MLIHDVYSKLKLSCPVVTIGIFDGVHLGHKVLLDYLVTYSKKIGGESVVVTFNPHPKQVLSEKAADFFLLTTIEEKNKLLEEALVGHLVTIDFTRALSETGACDFIRSHLIEKIGMKHLIIGYDHHLGRRQEGDLDTILKCSSMYGFKVVQVKEVTTPHGPVSSSIIRQMLLHGKVEEASKWLGYNYPLRGVIIEGRQIGRSIGFPTANIRPLDKNKLIPGNGVYAVEVEVEGKLLPGMLSIGYRPTVNFSTADSSIEVHIFGFEQNIYDREINIIFRFRLRDERKFDNISGLAEQMEHDKQKALRLLG